MADQYGIDMGNVLNTKDQIAMNKLKRTKIEKDISVQEAGEKNVYNRLKKENPNMSEDELKNMSLNSDLYMHDMERKEKKEDRAASFSNSLALQNHSLKNSKSLADYKAELKESGVKRERDRRLKIIKATNPDMPDDVAEAYAGEQSKDIGHVLDAITKAKDTASIDVITKAISKDGAMLHTISTIPDPNEQQAAWMQYRNQKLQGIKDPKVQAEAMKKMPEKFNANWTAMTIASSADLLKDAKAARDYQKRTEAEIKASQGDKIGGPTYAQETSKVNAISKKIDGFTKDLGDPKLGATLKAEVTKRWKEQGRKQNDDEIILQVIEEWEASEEGQNATEEEKGMMSKLWESVTGGSKEGSENALVSKPKKEKTEQPAAGKRYKLDKPDGVYPLKGGKGKIVVKNGIGTIQN